MKIREALAVINSMDMLHITEIHQEAICELKKLAEYHIKTNVCAGPKCNLFFCCPEVYKNEGCPPCANYLNK